MHNLDDGSAWEQPITRQDEFQWMKKILESGYAGQRASVTERLLKWLVNPWLLVGLLMVLAGLVSWVLG